MELPEQVKIGATYWTIEYYGVLLDSNGSQALGLCEGCSCTLKIVPHPKSFKATLFHEITHAISYFMSAKLKETQVDQISNGIRMLLLDNPELFEVFKSEQP